MAFYHLQTFNEIQKLLSKTNGKVISDVMTTAPLVVRENTNLEDAVRYLAFFLFMLIQISLISSFADSFLSIF